MSLRRGEELVRLAPKAFDTLVVLVEQRGEIVTKQQLMDAVWSGTYVEESNLAQNVFLLRKKLGHTADGGEYIETVPKRGYRMNVPVHQIEFRRNRRLHSGRRTAHQEALADVRPKTTYRGLLTAASLAAAMVVFLVARYFRPYSGSVPVGRLRSDHPRHQGQAGENRGFWWPDAALLTDGSRLYFTSGTSTSPSIWQVSANGGEPARVPVPFPFPQLLDFSIARSELLVAGSMDDVISRPLWSAPVPAGAPRRLGKLAARDASWSPDGHQIAFTEGTRLYLANESGSDIRKLADLPGIGWRPRWSPDGKLLRLTIADIESNTQYLWEVPADGSRGKRLLPGWSKPPFECCGVWSPDGNWFVFQATRDGKTDIWSLGGAEVGGAFQPGRPRSGADQPRADQLSCPRF